MKTTRRSFLQIVGAASAAAGCAVSSKGNGKLMPYVEAPESVPGVPTYYRTLCRGCSAGCGVTATTFSGRVTKLEGNPDEPSSGGALCARGQAQVQSLYAVDRFRGPMARGADGSLAPISWDDALAKIAEAIAAAKQERVRFLTRPEPGSAGEAQRRFLAAIGAPSTARVVVDPSEPAALRDAVGALYGNRALPAYDLAKARTVVAFGADFLESWLSPVELTRAFSTGRGVLGDARTRLVWVGSRQGATGAKADRWISAKAGSEALLASALVARLARVPSISPDAARIAKAAPEIAPAALEAASGVDAATMDALVAELLARRPSALLGPGMAGGGAQAPEVARALLLANHLLGNVGATVLLDRDPMLDPPSPPDDVHALVAALEGGLDVLLLQHSITAAVEDHAAKAKLVVSFAIRPDATSALAHLVLPDSHPLESHGDVTARRGLTVLGQPAMRPLFETREAAQTLFDLASKIPIAAGKMPSGTFADWQTSRTFPATADAKTIHRARARGVATFDVPASAPPVLRDPAPLSPLTPVAAEFSQVHFPTSLRSPAGSGTLPWMISTPDLVSSVAWADWVALSPAAAARLGVRDGDVVEVNRTPLSLSIDPGMRDDAVGLPLRPDGRGLVVGATGEPARVSRAGGSAELPRLSVVSEPKAGPNLLRVVGDGAPPTAIPEPPQKTMYDPPSHPGRRWAMAIDLDRCTGCNACSVACTAENNVPIADPTFVEDGRQMAWLRIERYWAERPEGGARMDVLPMLCQQCDNAPCESVCPVYATYHNPEGLNAQVYNRCVGTRYCANNCPYKVRTFNYREPEFPFPTNLQLNPDVTVRSKGVMEKCTFCVQRIRRVEITAEREGHRAIADGEVVPACAQTCPAEAIVFGDANDPGSRVAALRKDARGFRALEETNARPAITYLARIAPEERS